MNKENYFYSDINNSFCAQPWVGLQIAPDKSIRPCCMFDRDLGKYNGNESLSRAYSVGLIQDVRQTILNGKWHPDCLSCKREEELTGSSPRVFSPGLKETIQNHERDLSFQKVELFIDNLCNLDCVMCRPTFSSKWNQHIKNLNDQQINFNQLEAVNHARLKREDIDFLFTKCQSAKHIILIGGEPLASPECLYFLDLWSKNSSDAVLQITTNGTLLKDETLQLLEKCKNLYLQVSVDATDSVYEWIRGYSFKKLEINLRKISDRGISMLLSPTIGIFNAEHVSSLFEFAQSLGASIKFGHILRQPEFLSALNLDWGVRNRIVESLPNSHEDELPMLRKFLLNSQMPQKVDENLEKALAWIHYFDKVRGISLLSMSPLLKEAFSSRKSTSVTL
jgi:sulfatase maturation enzyme AslB (radical SAM superfamily)